MLYLSFPVAMFWISNQAEYFEEYIVKRKVINALTFIIICYSVLMLCCDAFVVLILRYPERDFPP